jgi:hypothetical protein
VDWTLVFPVDYKAAHFLFSLPAPLVLMLTAVAFC